MAAETVVAPASARDRRQAGVRFVVKRIVDLALGSIALVLASPLIAVAAIAIRLDSRGPVLYRGERLGRDLTPFVVLKLRTMHVDVDDKLHRSYLQRLLREAPTHRADDQVREMFKLTEDPRVTRVGRFLRRTSIDELPQLINVLRGEMSLVGPRPEVPYALEEYEPWELRRFDVLPGMTGLWQVRGRATLSPREMLELDVRYANEFSLGLDLTILLRTIPAVLTQTGSS